MKVRTQTAQERDPPRLRCRHQRPEKCGFVWNLFSMRRRRVGQLIFAVDSLATFAKW